MSNIPGWYLDALEQNMGALIVLQREKGIPVGALAEMFMDPTTGEGKTLTPEQHMETMATCLAICVRRLARIDIPA